MAGVLLTWPWKLLCAFHTNCLSVGFGEPDEFIFSVRVFRVSYPVFLDIIFNRKIWYIDLVLVGR